MLLGCEKHDRIAQETKDRVLIVSQLRHILAMSRKTPPGPFPASIGPRQKQEVISSKATPGGTCGARFHQRKGGGGGGAQRVGGVSRVSRDRDGFSRVSAGGRPEGGGGSR